MYFIGKLASSIPLHEGDYYGALVIVGILALMAILSTMILLMMLLKRRTSSKADISPRKTTSAYDNPSYKVELQQETLGNFCVLFVLLFLFFFSEYSRFLHVLLFSLFHLSPVLAQMLYVHVI